MDFSEKTPFPPFSEPDHKIYTTVVEIASGLHVQSPAIWASKTEENNSCSTGGQRRIGAPLGSPCNHKDRRRKEKEMKKKKREEERRRERRKEKKREGKRRKEKEREGKRRKEKEREGKKKKKKKKTKTCISRTAQRASREMQGKI